MTAALTPYSWPVKELTAARVALQCAIQGNFQRMAEHLQTLPPEALVDLRYALDVMHPIVKEMAEPKLMPCPRCGHGEIVHWSAGPARRGCGECATGNCEPRRVPAGVAQTVTVTDGEEEVR